MDVLVNRTSILDTPRSGRIASHVLDQLTIQILFDPPVGREAMPTEVARHRLVPVRLLVLRVERILPDVHDELAVHLRVGRVREEQPFISRIGSGEQIAEQHAAQFVV